VWAVTPFCDRDHSTTDGANVKSRWLVKGFIKLARKEMYSPMAVKVLVVDDEHTIADMLGLILARAGYECAVAYDGLDALRQAKEFHPDLLLSDVMMPGMNGLELAETLVGLQPGCLVLLISGNATTQDLLEAADAQGHSFPVLAKPMAPRQLLAAIAQIGAGTRKTAPSPAQLASGAFSEALAS